MTRSSDPIVLEFPLRLVSLGNARMHWAQKAKIVSQQRGVVMLEWRSKRRPKLKLPLTITLTRIAPRSLDRHDNLPSSLKPTADQLAAEIGFDDRDERVTWIYKQERGKPKEYRARIEITA